MFFPRNPVSFRAERGISTWLSEPGFEGFEGFKDTVALPICPGHPPGPLTLREGGRFLALLGMT